MLERFTWNLDKFKSETKSEVFTIRCVSEQSGMKLQCERSHSWHSRTSAACWILAWCLLALYFFFLVCTTDPHFLLISDYHFHSLYTSISPTAWEVFMTLIWFAILSMFPCLSFWLNFSSPLVIFSLYYADCMIDYLWLIFWLLFH